jgi:hypothetical protein
MTKHATKRTYTRQEMDNQAIIGGFLSIASILTHMTEVMEESEHKRTDDALKLYEDTIKILDEMLAEVA